MFLGIFNIDEYVPIPAVTHRFSSGAAYAPSTIVYSIYEEGNTTGLDEDVDMTPASPFDAIVGAYYSRRQLTSAAGFEAGKTYIAIVKATVDSIAAIEMHIFQIRVQQTGDAFARLGAPVGASISADVAAVKAETASILEDTGTTLPSTLSTIAGYLDTEIAAILEDTGTTLPATLVTLAGYIDTEVASILAAVDTEVAAIKAKTDNLPADPADQSAVEAAITAATSPLATAAALDIVDNFLDTEIAAILADTNELQTDLVNGGRLDLLIDAIKAKTDVIPAAPATEAKQDTIIGYIDTEVAAVLAAVDTEIAAILADTNELQTDLVNGGRLNLLIDAIKAKTDVIPAAPATEAKQDTIIGYIDTEVAAVLAAVDTEIAAILADTNELQTDLVNGGRLNLLIDGIKAKTDNLPTDPADQSAVEAAITAATSPLATTAALDAVDNYVDTEIAAIKAVTDKLDTAVELDGAVYKFTTNALEQAPTGGGTAPTVQEIVDGVLDELLSAHADVGSVGAGIAAAGAAGDPMSVLVPGSYAEGTAGYVIGHSTKSGAGSVYWPYTVTEASTGNPIAGVAVAVTTAIDGTGVIASGTTNAFGVVNFNLDPGTYYVWLTKIGYAFDNPDTEVII